MLCRSAQPDLFGSKVLALGGLHQIKIADVNVLLLREALGGACRRADGIVRHGLGRAGNFGFDVRLLCAQPFDPGRQAARRTEGLHGHAAKEALSGEQFFDVGSQFLFSLRKHPSRDLFAADFEKELHSLFYGSRLHARTSR